MSFVTKRTLTIAFSILSIIGYGAFVFAAQLPNGTTPPVGGYLAGDSILDPGCAPGDVDCFQNIGGGGSGPFSIVNGNSIFSTGLTDTGLNSIATNSFFTGDYAGANATDASYSNFIGQYSGQNATTASSSNFFGGYAGWGAANANSSNFLGFEAGYGATGANNSNFFGAQAGYNAASAFLSNFFGQNAGREATNAFASNFFGVSAGREATNAFASNFLGGSAGNQATNANFANFFGGSAGYGAVNANNSNFFGYEAGEAATNANNSNFLGQRAGENAINAANSFFAGLNAGSNDTVDNTGNSDDFSILLGNFTSTGGYSNSIALGAYAANTATNQFMIGSGTRPINDLIITGTGSLFLPTGDDSQRTSYATNGAIRYSTTQSCLEMYSGSSWACVGGGGGSGAFTGITGTPTEVAYFDALGNGTSDSTFTFNDSTKNLTVYKYTPPNINYGTVSFSGSGINDLTYTGTFVGGITTTYTISVDDDKDNFSWSSDQGGSGSDHTPASGFPLNNGITIDLPSTGYTQGDVWTFTITVTGSEVGSVTTRKLVLNGSNNNNAIGLFAPQGNLVNSYNIFLPNDQGAPNTTLINDGAGNLSWGSISGGGSGPFSVLNGDSIFSTGLSGTGLNSNVGGSFFVGQDAGRDATNATYSNFLGTNAGNSATNAYFSNFFGLSAGNGATNAFGSNFFGVYAGRDATDASYSNFLGRDAGQNATTANNSNFLGYSAGNGATNANDSNFLGYYAGGNATDAANSFFAGRSAGQDANNATHSNFFGDSAGFQATNASNSNFLGRSAGIGAANASNSNFLGRIAGSNAANAANSLFIGQEAGSNDTVNNTTNPNDFSILLGNFTSTGGFSNSIAIGAFATNTATNQFMIGSTTRPINTTRFQGSSVGTQCTITTGTGIACTSDERLKTNIIDISSGVLDKLGNIRTVNYNLIGDTSNRYQVGFLAQNLEQYFPELVDTNADGYKSVYYAQMTPILVEGIKELNIKLTDIQKVADGVDQTFVTNMRNWLGSVTNGITLIISDTLKARNQICIDDVCMTKDQLRDLLAKNNAGPVVVPVVPVVPPTPTDPIGSDTSTPSISDQPVTDNSGPVTDPGVTPVPDAPVVSPETPQ
ncbi:MAG: tail fiber domain-containing protein [bacterium]